MRVKKNINSNKKLIKRLSKGFKKKNIYIKTKQSVIKSLIYNFISRKKRKILYRSYFIKKINIILKKLNINYNKFSSIKKMFSLSTKIFYFLIIFDKNLFLKILNLWY